MLKSLLKQCIFLLLAACVINGCSDKSFKITANIKGLGNQNVRVVYCGSNGGVIDMWQTAQNDALEITGECYEPTLMMVYNSMNVPIMRLLVDRGDNIEVEGNLAEPYEYKIKGSEVMSEWNAFSTKHKNEYNTQALNAAIEKYVKDNPKSIVSTVLALVDYAPSDDDKVASLLKSVDDSAKPQSLMESYNIIMLRKEKPESRLTTLNLLELTTGDFETAKFNSDKPSVILFWDKNIENDKRKATIKELKMIDNSITQIVDINIDSDSTGWNSTIAKDSTQWKHYWVPGSMMNSEIIKLQIRNTPTIIVTDSLGRQKYRGNDAIKARQTIETMK